MHTRPGPAITDLKPGDHLCLIYDTEKEHRAVLTPFLRQGLERGEKVIYIADTRTPEAVLSYLHDDGLAPEPYLDRGQLVILTCDDACMRDGIFDPDEMIALLRAETEKALAEGYPALRVTGEMSWALRGLPGSERLMEYEAKLNEFFPRSKCLAICQYDRRQFEPEALLDVLRTHPLVIIGTEILDNFYFVSPRELRRDNLPAVTLNRWIKHLQEHKQLEETLRENEAKYRALVEQSLVGVYLFTKDHFAYVNRALAKSFGYSVEELVGRLGPLDLTHPDDRPRVVENIRKRLEGEIGAIHYTFRGLRKDGRTIFCKAFGSCISYKGKPAVIGTLVDITERVQTEEALRQSEQRYRALVEAAPDVIFTLSMDGTITSLNPAFERLTGWSRSEWLGKHFSSLVHPEDLPAAKDLFQRALRTRKPLTYELRILTKSGHYLVGEFTSTPQLVEGEVVGILGIARDITDRKQMEEELRQSFEKLHMVLQETVHALAAAIESRDPYTAGHQRRVAQLACAIAKELDLSSDQIRAIQMAADVHDIGKVSVPAEILSKPGQLTEPEFDLIKTHPQVAYDILKQIDFPWPIAEIVLQHHERLDGSGYPNGLKGTDILLEARILAVADVVEAMSSHRPYRPAFSVEKALEEISKNRGTLYDSQVVDACLRLFREKKFKFQEST